MKDVLYSIALIERDSSSLTKLPCHVLRGPLFGCLVQRSLYRDLFNQNGMDFVSEYLV